MVARWMAASRRSGLRVLRALDKLDLTNCEIRETQVGLLIRPDAPKELDLGSNARIGADGADTIARALTKRPQRLSLESCRIGDEGAKALAVCRAELERLELGDNGITDAGLAALVKGTLKVRERSIAQSRITATGVRALLAAEWPLVELDSATTGRRRSGKLVASRRPRDRSLARHLDNTHGEALMALIGAER